ncbi:MAG TPA: DUF2239 family protein [Dongiaceae bacterium]|jgi:hypothetical protein
MTDIPATARYTAFLGQKRWTAGAPADVAIAARDATEEEALLVFDDATGHQIDLDLRGSEAEIRHRYAPQATEEAPKGPGRPKLGVVPREVTLLPRHWDWLNTQPGGASVALRKLVDDARRSQAAPDRMRAAKDKTYRFMSAMAGNETGFEEAARALFAGDRPRFEAETAAWPVDLRNHARQLAADCFETK